MASAQKFDENMCWDSQKLRPGKSLMNDFLTQGTAIRGNRWPGTLAGDARKVKQREVMSKSLESFNLSGNGGICVAFPSAL